MISGSEFEKEVFPHILGFVTSSFSAYFDFSPLHIVLQLENCEKKFKANYKGASDSLEE